MQISATFPRYTQYDPLVPIWCVTPNTDGCLHRFFDTSPISPSGRYLAVLQMPYEDHLPEPGDSARILVVDLTTGAEHLVATTCGWESQMGANLNWGADDDTLIYNDVDTTTWTPHGVRLNPWTGEKLRLHGGIYQVSPDGRKALGSTMSAMRRTQYGYGVVIPDGLVPRNIGLRDDDGLFITDTKTGESRLLISLREVVERTFPADELATMKDMEVYGFHSKWNPQGTRLIFTVRYFPTAVEPQWSMIRNNLHFEVFTLREDGSDLHRAIPDSEWQKGGHHINWFPDGKHLSMNLAINRDGLRFVQANYDGSDLHAIFAEVPGSGHPSIHPDMRHLVTDSYVGEAIAFGDGTTPARWVDLHTGEEQLLARIQSRITWESREPALRVDPHPAWDRTHQFLTFNAVDGNTRRVYIADMRTLL